MWRFTAVCGIPFSPVYRMGSMTARKYRSNSAGDCFLRPRIHHRTISTKLPEI